MLFINATEQNNDLKFKHQYQSINVVQQENGHARSKSCPKN